MVNMGRLIPVLQQRGHSVAAVVRTGSKGKLPAGCMAVVGDALDASTYMSKIEAGDTFIQLVGVAHPSPAKAAEFIRVDGKSGMEAIRAAAERGVSHFIYVSVAHPAPVMHAYIAPRVGCERAIRDSGMNATILRPWYVLGPGHRWPYMLKPLYWLAERIPSKRGAARRLGLVTLEQMVDALAACVDAPARGVRVVEVPEIRRGVTASAATRTLP